LPWLFKWAITVYPLTNISVTLVGETKRTFYFYNFVVYVFQVRKMFKLHRNLSQAWTLDDYQSILNRGIYCQILYANSRMWMDINVFPCLELIRNYGYFYLFFIFIFYHLLFYKCLHRHALSAYKTTFSLYGSQTF